MKITAKFRSPLKTKTDRVAQHLEELEPRAGRHETWESRFTKTAHCVAYQSVMRLWTYSIGIILKLEGRVLCIGSPFIIASSIVLDMQSKEFKDSKYSIHFIFICILPTIKWRKIYLNICFNILYQMIYCQ